MFLPAQVPVFSASVFQTLGRTSAVAVVEQQGWVASLIDPEGWRMDRLQAVQCETALLHFGKPAERQRLQKLEKYDTLMF